MNSFTYKGIDSADMGLRIQSKNIFTAPDSDRQFVSIPGRHGDLISPHSRFANVQVSYAVFVKANSITELTEKITEIKAWLYTEQNKYHTLTDTYDESYIRLAVFSGKLNISEQLNKIGIFTISFSAKPFRYDKTGQASITIPSSGSQITNPEQFESLPIITIKGSGNISFSILNTSGGYSKAWNIKSLSNTIIFDSELMNCYYQTTLLNNKVTGDGFPVLMPGKSTITWTGNITSFQIIPRWVTI